MLQTAARRGGCQQGAYKSLPPARAGGSNQPFIASGGLESSSNPLLPLRGGDYPSPISPASGSGREVSRRVRAPETAQDGSKMAQESSRWPPEWLMIVSNMPSRGHKTAPTRLHVATEPPKDAPEKPQSLQNLKKHVLCCFLAVSLPMGFRSRRTRKTRRTSRRRRREQNSTCPILKATGLFWGGLYGPERPGDLCDLRGLCTCKICRTCERCGTSGTCVCCAGRNALK